MGRARTYVLRSTCQGFSLCASALKHDGYLNTASGETTDKTTTGSGKAAAESDTASGETTVKTTTGSGTAVAESDTASGETTGSAQAAAKSFSGALTKEHLEDLLMPPQLYRHKLWACLRTQFVDWDAQAACAIEIMCA